MRAALRPEKNRSIRFTLLSLLVAIVVLTVAVMMFVIALTTQNLGSSAQRLGEEIIIAQSQDYLLQTTASSAKEHREILQKVIDEARKLSGYIGSVYDQAETIHTDRFYPAAEKLSRGEEGQFLNGPEDVSSVFIPRYIEPDEAISRDIELGAYLDLLFPYVYQNVPNVEAIYFATPNEVTRYYPNVELGKVIPADFRVTERIWFVISRPENNPNRETRWTSLYVDAAGSGLVTTVASPVYDQKGNFIGVIGLDITLDALVAKIEATQLLQGGYSFVINEVGHAIALPDQGFWDILGREQAPGEFNIDLKRSPNQFADVIKKMTLGQSGVESIRVEEEEYYVAYVPIDNVDWSMGSVIPADEVLQPVYLLSTELADTSRSLLLLRTLPISLLILVGAVIVGLYTTNRIVKPLQNLAGSVEKMADGEWQIHLPTSSYLEISTLTQAFLSMAAQIQQMLQDLERRVESRTRDLERRSKQIQVAAQVARDATAVRKLETLLWQTVALLYERYGFAHTAAYLMDDRKAFVVLKAASGQNAQALVDSLHKVKVGDASSIGFAAANGQARISGQVDPVNLRRLNPLYPEFRSELAMPLKIGKKVIGVLHVASALSDTFDEDDAVALQIVADQTAVAIDNAHLFDEVQESLNQLQLLYGSYNQNAWQQFEKSSTTSGYRYDASGVSPLYNQSEPHDLTPVSVPLMVRGQQIGALEVWFEDENAAPDQLIMLTQVGERIAQAMESARIFEETQARMAREKALNQMISRFNHSLDLDTLLQNAVIEMGQLPEVAEVSIIVGSTSSSGGSQGNGSH